MTSSALLFTEKWQFERAGKTEKWRLQMFRFLVRILEEETGEEIDDFHNVGFRLDYLGECRKISFL